jgi:hypothetical protein
MKHNVETSQARLRQQEAHHAHVFRKGFAAVEENVRLHLRIQKMKVKQRAHVAALEQRVLDQKLRGDHLLERLQAAEAELRPKTSKYDGS